MKVSKYVLTDKGLDEFVKQTLSVRSTVLPSLLNGLRNKHKVDFAWVDTVVCDDDNLISEMVSKHGGEQKNCYMMIFESIIVHPLEDDFNSLNNLRFKISGNNLLAVIDSNNRSGDRI